MAIEEFEKILGYSNDLRGLYNRIITYLDEYHCSFNDANLLIVHIHKGNTSKSYWLRFEAQIIVHDFQFRIKYLENLRVLKQLSIDNNKKYKKYKSMNYFKTADLAFSFIEEVIESRCTI